MALTGIDIYKLLPKTNCAECGVPTCLAFAMKLAAGQAELSSCPHLSEEAKAALSEAAAPPIRLVTIGKGDKAAKVGGELVMFRHEKTFYNPCAFALLLDDTMEAKEIDEKLMAAKESQFVRVEQELRGDAMAVRAGSNKPEKFVELIEKVRGSLDWPLILMSDNPEVIHAGLAVCGDSSPLIYAANKGNAEKMAELAKQHGTSLAVRSSDGLDELAGLAEKVEGLGVKEIVLDPGSRSVKDTLKNLVYLRRAALVKKVRALGYPTITFPAEEADDEMMEALIASIYTAKYGSIIVLRDLQPYRALPLFVLRQNIYTDPQRPMQVKQGVYPIGAPKEDSPVMVTTNFSLTYFIVSGEVEASRVPSWLCVMDTEGLSVMTAWAAGKFVPEKIAPFVKGSEVVDKVKHRKLIIPGYLAQISGELEDELKDWKVEVGPREAGDLPAFLKGWSA